MLTVQIPDQLCMCIAVHCHPTSFLLFYSVLKCCQDLKLETKLMEVNDGFLSQLFEFFGWKIIFKGSTANLSEKRKKGVKMEIERSVVLSWQQVFFLFFFLLLFSVRLFYWGTWLKKYCQMIERKQDSYAENNQTLQQISGYEEASARR